MKFGLTYDEQIRRQKKDKEYEIARMKPFLMWHKWFAWHPVRLDDGRRVWLETILRRLDEIVVFDERRYYRHYREFKNATSKTE
jgi:hypothetical protein